MNSSIESPQATSVKNSARIYFQVFMIIAVLFAVESWAAGDKLLSYQENYPRSGHWYEFTTQSFCKESAKPIALKDYTSEVKTKKGIGVRVIHLYADANNKNCKERVEEPRSIKFVIPVDAKRTTHVYVTYDADLEIKSGQ